MDFLVTEKAHFQQLAEVEFPPLSFPFFFLLLFFVLLFPISFSLPPYGTSVIHI